MDIAQLIADDHSEQRRLFALIDQLGPDEGAALTSVWARLRALLDTHARAEELYFYPALLKLGCGADGKAPEAETKDAIKDHNEIRDAAAKVDSERPGSQQWFKAVAAANKANSDHMAEEERQGLTDFRQHADLELRRSLAVEFIRFTSDHLTGVKPVDLDVDDYVMEHS